MRNILIVSSEAVPFVKTGGLADVVGTLPRYIDKDNFEVRVIIPKYACMDKKFNSDLKFVCHFYINLNWRKQYVGIFETEYAGIKYYFVDNEFYFAGPNPYNNIYEDVEKFAYFSKAVLAALPYIDFQADVIHCNDWQTGLVPVFLKTQFGSDPYYQCMRTIYSIHNMKFQGRWKIKEVKDITGLADSIFSAQGLESYGESNYLKGGIVYSDYITTVSPTYAKDIATPEGGEGLDGLMYSKKDCLFGILNGLDYNEFDPQKDEYLYSNFSFDNMVEGKKANKTALQREMGLPSRPEPMLIGMVSRMTDQKGFDLVEYMLDEILSTLDVQMVVLGSGEERYENMFRHFASKYPEKLSANIGYSEELAHRIYASCDSFLMPSLFEPCGLSQLMAMRYGTVPIVRETGGLKDTVIPYNEFNNTGTGFSFAQYNAHDMLNAIKYANKVYCLYRSNWNDIARRGMKEEFSWDASAMEYERLYQ